MANLEGIFESEEYSVLPLTLENIPKESYFSADWKIIFSDTEERNFGLAFNRVYKKEVEIYGKMAHLYVSYVVPVFKKGWKIPLSTKRVGDYLLTEADIGNLFKRFLDNIKDFTRTTSMQHKISNTSIILQPSGEMISELDGYLAEHFPDYAIQKEFSFPAGQKVGFGTFYIKEECYETVH